ncbi:TPA: hypothetical protein ACS50C_004472 [Salmonella enterica]|nr:hypothetical protein [Salmonella enterica subsp. enterica serovar Mountpleasant]
MKPYDKKNWARYGGSVTLAKIRQQAVRLSALRWIQLCAWAKWLQGKYEQTPLVMVGNQPLANREAPGTATLTFLQGRRLSAPVI